ncbi:hypothetical protein [Streptomyces brevispora]|uniref:Uncharacterized protein n=1 Tax=Streptomyces brevispora TaxID=887462 RepID=A0ABZ1G360_9ACTN|nr:hypothetical protein [Streptomyces brevispora]WSC14332.1 hypothetical protein OIE64_16780 [Streptomyces brevispora]
MPNTTPTTRGGLAALLAHHADVLAARWYAVAPGPGAWEVAAALALRDHASDLTAEEETPFVCEFLDSVLAFEAEQQARLVLGTTDQQPETTPADTGLRDRIRRAICEADGFGWDTDMLEPDEYGEQADAVLAVLPAPVDRAAVLTDAERTMLTYALDQAQERIWSDDGFTDEDQAAVTSLRRLADEAQQPETAGCKRCGCSPRCCACDFDEAQQPETEAHACGNCDGIDPDTCFNNPHRSPEQCPAAEFEDYGQQCQKPVGHELHTFEEQPAAAEPDTETEAAPPGGFATRVCRNCWHSIAWRPDGTWTHEPHGRDGGHTAKPPQLPHPAP